MADNRSLVPAQSRSLVLVRSGGPLVPVSQQREEWKIVLQQGPLGVVYNQLRRELAVVRSAQHPSILQAMSQLVEAVPPAQQQLLSQACCPVCQHPLFPRAARAHSPPASARSAGAASSSSGAPSAKTPLAVPRTMRSSQSQSASAAIPRGRFRGRRSASLGGADDFDAAANADAAIDADVDMMQQSSSSSSSAAAARGRTRRHHVRAVSDVQILRSRSARDSADIDDEDNSARSAADADSAEAASAEGDEDGDVSMGLQHDHVHLHLHDADAEDDAEAEAEAEEEPIDISGAASSRFVAPGYFHLLGDFSADSFDNNDAAATSARSEDAAAMEDEDDEAAQQARTVIRGMQRVAFLPAPSPTNTELLGGASSSSSSAAASKADGKDSSSSSRDDGSDRLSSSAFNNGYYARFFQEGRKIGSGGFGGVWLTHHALDGVELGTYAVKKIPVGNSRPWLLKVLKEVRALERLHHPNIVTYKHSWLELFKPSDFGPEIPCLFLLMEYADRGTVSDVIWPAESDGSHMTHAARVRRARALQAQASGVPAPIHYMREDEIWRYFIDVCLGLQHLHSAGIVHRDLKPENLLLASDYDGNRSGTRVLVSDFGQSAIKGQEFLGSGYTGTISYCAPEVLQRMCSDDSSPSAAKTIPITRGDGKQQSAPSSSSNSAGNSSSDAKDAQLQLQIDEQSDLWSLGVVLFAMAFSHLPWTSTRAEDLLHEITSKPLEMPAVPKRSNELIQLLTQLLLVDPSKRPSLRAILTHSAVLARDVNRRIAEDHARRGVRGRRHRPHRAGPSASPESRHQQQQHTTTQQSSAAHTRSSGAGNGGSSGMTSRLSTDSLGDSSGDASAHMSSASATDSDDEMSTSSTPRQKERPKPHQPTAADASTPVKRPAKRVAARADSSDMEWEVTASQTERSAKPGKQRVAPMVVDADPNLCTALTLSPLVGPQRHVFPLTASTLSLAGDDKAESSAASASAQSSSTAAIGRSAHEPRRRSSIPLPPGLAPISLRSVGNSSASADQSVVSTFIAPELAVHDSAASSASLSEGKAIAMDTTDDTQPAVEPWVQGLAMLLKLWLCMWSSAPAAPAPLHLYPVMALAGLSIWLATKPSGGRRKRKRSDQEPSSSDEQAAKRQRSTLVKLGVATSSALWSSVLATNADTLSDSFAAPSSSQAVGAALGSTLRAAGTWPRSTLVVLLSVAILALQAFGVLLSSRTSSSTAARDSDGFGLLAPSSSSNSSSSSSAAVSAASTRSAVRAPLPLPLPPPSSTPVHVRDGASADSKGSAASLAHSTRNQLPPASARLSASASVLAGTSDSAASSAPSVQVPVRVSAAAATPIPLQVRTRSQTRRRAPNA